MVYLRFPKLKTGGTSVIRGLYQNRDAQSEKKVYWVYGARTEVPVSKI